MGKSRTSWLALFVTAMALRLSFGLLAPHLGILDDTGWLVAKGSDGYEKIARNLLSGNGYRIRADIAPTMMRNPGYVAALTATFALFGDSRIVGLVLQALISATVVVLIGLLGRPIVGSGAAFLAATLYAVYPADWVACARYIAEPMLGLLLLSMLLALRRWINRPSLAHGAVLGAAAGLSALTKSVAVYVLPFLLLWIALFVPQLRRRWRSLILPAGLALAVSLLTLSPWAWYNYSRSGHWVFTSTVVGVALFDTQYLNGSSRQGAPRVDLWLQARAEARRLGEQAGIHADERDEWTFSFFDIRDEYAMDDLLKRYALQTIKAHPFAFVKGVLRGTAEFWYATRSNAASLIGASMNLPILLLAFFGVLNSQALRHSEVICWIGVIVYVNLITALSLAVARYAIPIMPLVCLLAAVGGLRLVQGWTVVRRSDPIRSA